VELPFWNAKNRAGVREAERMRASGLAAREDAERQNAFDVQDAAFQLQTARRSLALYRTELIPQAAARLSASEAGYRTGKVDFMDLLESERFLLDAKVMAVMTEGAAGMQAARLERATGAAWPRSGGVGEEK
jgi:outer membrane protein TolC